MTTPKGMRSVRLPVSETDAVHVYSDSQHIWIQLRRDVPTEHDIGKPSFKTALCLTPSTAQKLASELLKSVERNKGKQKAKAAASSEGTAVGTPVKAAVVQNGSLCPRCRKSQTIEHDGRQWCSQCGKFTTGRNAYPVRSKTPKAARKAPTIDLITKQRSA